MATDCAYSGRTVLSYLLMMAGDKGIKCPSRSLGQHRGGPLGAPPFATMAVACHRTPQAARCPATCLWGSPGATRGRVSWSAGLKWRLAAASGLPWWLSFCARELAAHQALPERVVRRS